MKDIVQTRLPNQHSFSENNIQWIRNYLKECRKNHARCNKHRQQTQSLGQPRYLLDLGSCGDGQVRLIEPGKSTDFATLSYCWGQPPPDYTTTSTHLQYHLAVFSLKNLPKTSRCHRGYSSSRFAISLGRCTLYPPGPRRPDDSERGAPRARVEHCYRGRLYVAQQCQVLGASRSAVS